MQILTTVAQLRAWRAACLAAGRTVALVPTMGNLHRGHLELVALAKAEASVALASIFVNPTQFGAHDDLSSYPRTPTADCQRLRAAGCDAVFMPEVEQMYPQGSEGMACVDVPGLSDILCGASRPGHFVGVATVVCKLFNLAQPDVAVFGQKDFQQLMVIRRLVRDLNFPVRIVGAPIVREADGLAMSSRNRYLSAEQRAVAPLLHRVLEDTAAALRGGGETFADLRARGLARWRSAGMRADYLAIRRRENLNRPLPDDHALVILAAVFLGRARLIDNVTVDLPV